MSEEKQRQDLWSLIRLIKAGDSKAMKELIAIYQPEIDKEVQLGDLPQQEQEDLKSLLILSVLEAANYFDETVDYTAMTSEEIEEYMQKKRKESNGSKKQTK